MDKEFGSNQLAAGQVGWDWFSLQLADGRDLMLYLLRDADGRVLQRSGTLVDGAGVARDLAAAAWSVQVEATWRSPATGIRYPGQWTVSLPAEGLMLELLPLAADQENRSLLAGGLTYWEGAVRVRDARGQESGRGFVELTGYGAGNRPPL
jgi:predicted secreted hydrolase